MKGSLTQMPSNASSKNDITIKMQTSLTHQRPQSNNPHQRNQQQLSKIKQRSTSQAGLSNIYKSKNPEEYYNTAQEFYRTKPRVATSHNNSRNKLPNPKDLQNSSVENLRNSNEKPVQNFKFSNKDVRRKSQHNKTMNIQNIQTLLNKK